MQLITKILIVLMLITSNAFAGITFDSTDDFLGVGTMGSFGGGLDTKYFVTSFYFKSSVTGSAITPFGFFNTGTTTAIRMQFNVSPVDGLTVSAGKIIFFRRDEGGDVRAGGVNSNTGITDGSWHHVVVSCAHNSSPKIWIDGTSQTIYDFSTASADVLNNLGFQMMIGAYNNRGTAAGEIGGTMTEVAMWSSTAAPSAGDVTTLNTHTRGGPLSVSTLNGLAGYWKMNEGTSGSANGASITDYSGNGNTGTADDGANNTGLTWNDDSDLFTGSSSSNSSIQNSFIKDSKID